jgi:GT2 family glycosyltransferase
MMRSSTTKPRVTIVVVPRERFSATRASLESIYAHTQIPFELVYVDGGSPRHIQRYLEAQAAEKRFQLVRTEYYLSPNRARNLGLRQVSTTYVVFIDNDVIVAPGWLSPLVQCAEETAAAIVSPLICQGEPLHDIVHCAGGESGVCMETKDGQIQRRLIEKIYKQGQRVAAVRDQLQRHQTGLAEFHCMLVRTEIFARVGFLDEALRNTKEHVDFCMTVAQAGGTVYLEPASMVTYLFGTALEWSDMPYYALRWSDAWELASLHRLRDKWNLTEDDYFLRKYKNLGWRRHMTFVGPLSARLTFGRRNRFLEKTLIHIDKTFNRYFTGHYVRKHPQCLQGSQRSA